MKYKYVGIQSLWCIYETNDDISHFIFTVSCERQVKLMGGMDEFLGIL